MSTTIYGARDAEGRRVAVEKSDAVRGAVFVVLDGKESVYLKPEQEAELASVLSKLNERKE